MLINALAVVAGVLLCALALLICADVFGRKLGLYTIAWSFDVAEYALYAITFLAAPWVLKDGGHISVDLFTQRVSIEWRRRLFKLATSIGALVSACLCLYACRVCWISYRENVQIYETFVFPEWYLLSVAPPIFFLLFCLFARSLKAHIGARTSPGQYTTE